MGDMQSHTKGTYVSPKLGAALCPQSAPQLPPHRIPQWTPSPQCPHSPSRDHWGRGAGPHPNAAHGAAVPRCPSTATITPRPQHVPIAPTPPSPTPAPRRDPHGLSPLPVAGLSAACQQCHPHTHGSGGDGEDEALWRTQLCARGFGGRAPPRVTPRCAAEDRGLRGRAAACHSRHCDAMGTDSRPRRRGRIATGTRGAVTPIGVTPQPRDTQPQRRPWAIWGL